MRRGSLKILSATQRAVTPGGFSSTQMSSHHVFAPPSHGILSGKFAPPATISASPCTPTNGPATPGWVTWFADGGSGDSSLHCSDRTLACPPTQEPCNRHRKETSRT